MARVSGAEFVCRAVELDGETYRYAVHVPGDFAPDRPWPAILYLHGIGERGDDGIKHTTVGLGKAVRENPERFECVIVMPQCRDGQNWTGPMRRVALAALEASTVEFKLDPDRIVLTGLSLGGYGAWSIGASSADRFCAVVPICGGGDPGDAGKLASLPIWCFHGDADTVVPVERSREMVEAVRARGGQVIFTIIQGVGHNCWDPAYGNSLLIDWMMAQNRAFRAFPKARRSGGR